MSLFEMNLNYFGGYNCVSSRASAAWTTTVWPSRWSPASGWRSSSAWGRRQWWKKGVALFAAALMGPHHPADVLARRHAGPGRHRHDVVLPDPEVPRHYMAFACRRGGDFAGEEIKHSSVRSSNRIRASTKASAQSRLDLWTGTFDATLKRPLLGAGPDDGAWLPI